MSIRTAEDFDALVARIKEQDREIKAWRAFSGNSALKAARIGEFDHARRPLEGLTVGVKDIIDVAGLPTRYGSPLFENAPPATRDATVAAKMREAGAIIVGKTVTTELATFVPAETRNPRDLTRTPGGSSSGSAAAVAAGHVDIAIGTQTAGSIIRPAAYCGVYGFKPSFGLVPTDGVLVQCPSFDTVGVFARSLAHIEAWVAAVGVWTGQPKQIPQEETPSVVRIGLLGNGPDLSLCAEMRLALDHAISTWECAGHRVVQVDTPSPLTTLGEAHRLVQQYESAQVFANEFAPCDSQLKEYVRIGRMIPHGMANSGSKTIEAWRQWLRLKSAEIDVILLPSAPDAAPVGLQSTGSPDLARFASAVGRPVISLPSALVGGLGLQLVGLSACHSRFLKVVRALDTLQVSPSPEVQRALA